MKRMTKLLSLLLIAASLLTLFACKKPEGKDPETGSEDTFTLVIAGDVITEYTIPLSKISGTDGLVSVLEYLEEIDALEYEMGSTGMLESVGELENDAATSTWIYIYTTVESDIDVSTYAVTVEYDGITITSSGVGASDMHISGGATIYIGTVKF